MNFIWMQKSINRIGRENLIKVFYMNHQESIKLLTYSRNWILICSFYKRLLVFLFNKYKED